MSKMLRIHFWPQFPWHKPEKWSIKRVPKPKWTSNGSLQLIAKRNWSFLDPKLTCQSLKIYFSGARNALNSPIATFPMTQNRKIFHEVSSLGYIDLKWSNLAHSLQKLANLDPYWTPLFRDPKYIFCCLKCFKSNLATFSLEKWSIK